jgi:hypothetical protein
MVNISADNVDTMVDNHQVMPPDQCHEMREHTPRQQPQVCAPSPQTTKPHPRPHVMETDEPSGNEFFKLPIPRIFRLTVPTWQDADLAGMSTDVNVDPQLLRK